MPIRKSINNTDLWEIKDHLEATAWELVKCYTLAQLSLIDWKDTRFIRHYKDYLPVRIDTAQSLRKYRIWENKKPYMIAWIRLDEIKDLYSKRSKWKKLKEE